MYDPSIGRWFTEDPIEFEAGDADLYRYVGNNPTNAIDPTGEKIKIKTKQITDGNDLKELIETVQKRLPTAKDNAAMVARAIFLNPYDFQYDSDKQFVRDVALRVYVLANSKRLVDKLNHGFVDTNGKSLAWVSKASDNWKNFEFQQGKPYNWGIAAKDPKGVRSLRCARIAEFLPDA